MTAVNMGDRPSATIAQVALRKTAEMNSAQFKEASEIITKNSYMDDILRSEEHTSELQSQFRISYAVFCLKKKKKRKTKKTKKKKKRKKRKKRKKKKKEKTPDSKKINETKQRK